MANLSKSEERLARLYADGYGVESIAGRLGIAPRTVDLHRRKLGDKLGAATLTQLGYRFAAHDKTSATKEMLECVTPRSLAVAQLKLAGRSNKAIAAQLAISLRQVEYRLEHLRAATDSQSAAQLGYRLAQHGIEANARPPAPPSGREPLPKL